MRRRSYRILTIGTLIFTSGCVQAVRHSNAVIFGTTTSVGVRVGPNATSVPEVQIGYSRQEAVLMPLVANTGSTPSGNGRTDMLTPCDLTSEVSTRGAAQFAVHPCSLVAINGSALDSYSVLASFGGRFSGKGTAEGGEAAVGLSQYFATGMAAQMLAIHGGAAVVAVSQAAEEAAENRPAASVLSNLYSNPQAFQVGRARNDAYLAFRQRLIAKIDATDADDLSARVAAFESAAGANDDLASDCPSIMSCIDAVRENDPYRTGYGAAPNRFEEALRAWSTDPE